MTTKALALALVFCVYSMVNEVKAQTATDSYHETAEKINDLVHTRLDARFDFQNKYLLGKEWLTLKPHFYPTDLLQLDAKGMDVHVVSLFKNNQLLPLKFRYDGNLLFIHLDRSYKNQERYTVFINYTAKPDELKNRKKNEKGLYFINPLGKDSAKPIQVWTEGEPESASVWIPTIDKPNQKTTQEFLLTVPGKFTTLSNGKLVSKNTNLDGTRTDTWKMDLPNAPYLFVMAVGDFKIYKDNWKGKEVSYYLEPAYAPYAKLIFGETPEAIDCFSKTLNFPFPWNKYSQVIVRDYVSGAMENTTATMMGEDMQGTPKELADRYYHTGIAHELFHQWFGDYVTAESWAHLTLNESLAVFGELVWLEYKYGKDVADAHNLDGMQAYLNNEGAKNKDLVRFYYKEPADVFDGVSYQKGGSILNMLRNYLGNEAFYKGLNLYLKENALRPAEAHQLRLALEEASGKDLNWFFNQWYFGAGHPEINISYQWDEDAKTQTVYLQQTQEGSTFILPISIDFYFGNKTERRQIWMNSKTDTIAFRLARKPDLVNVDADKVLVAKKRDEKSISEFAFQYFHAPLFADRYEALEAAVKSQNEKDAEKIMIAALSDRYFGLRIKSIRALDTTNASLMAIALPILKELALHDQNNLVKASAIEALGKLKQRSYLSLFKEILQTDSYAVQGASLIATGYIDPDLALEMAKKFETDSKHEVADAILNLYTNYGNNDQWMYIYDLFLSLAPPRQYNIIKEFARLTGRVQSSVYARQGIDAIKKLALAGKKFGIADTAIALLNEIKKERLAYNDSNSAQSVDDAVKEIIAAK